MASPRQGKRAPVALAAESVAQEPVWLVRLAILLFLVGFAAFLARELANLVRSF